MGGAREARGSGGAADDVGLGLEERMELRRTESRPIIDEIYTWITKQPALPKSMLGKAIGYTQRLWSGLVLFVEDARLPLDTNRVERGMRGTKVAALLYSLVETAKLAGVDPRAYLAEATRRAIANPGAVTLPRDLLSNWPLFHCCSRASSAIVRRAARRGSADSYDSSARDLRCAALIAVVVSPSTGRAESIAATRHGLVVLELPRTWSDGTTHILLEPGELLERLAALTPRPRINLIICSGLFAGHASGREAAVARAAEPPGRTHQASTPPDDQEAKAPRRRQHRWADLMRRALECDVLRCPRCPGRLRFIATIESPEAIRRILTHLASPPLCPARSPPELPLGPQTISSKSSPPDYPLDPQPAHPCARSSLNPSPAGVAPTRGPSSAPPCGYAAAAWARKPDLARGFAVAAIRRPGQTGRSSFLSPQYP